MHAPSTKIRAVVFDMDDTLYPEIEYVLSGYRAVGEYLRKQTGSGERFEQWLWERFLAGEYKQVFDAMDAYYSLNLGPEGIGELVKIYRGHAPDISPYRSVERMLGTLGGEYKLGLLTDGFLPAQRLKLEALGLEKFFRAVVFTEELGGREYWKPSPAGFEAIAGQMGVEHAACVYVADNPAKDFLAPNNLGWMTVRMNRRAQVHTQKESPPGGRPQHAVDNNEQLIELIGRF